MIKFVAKPPPAIDADFADVEERNEAGERDAAARAAREQRDALERARRAEQAARTDAILAAAGLPPHVNTTPIQLEVPAKKPKRRARRGKGRLPAGISPWSKGGAFRGSGRPRADRPRTIDDDASAPPLYAVGAGGIDSSFDE